MNAIDILLTTGHLDQLPFGYAAATDSAFQQVNLYTPGGLLGSGLLYQDASGVSVRDQGRLRNAIVNAALLLEDTTPGTGNTVLSQYVGLGPPAPSLTSLFDSLPTAPIQAPPGVAPKVAVVALVVGIAVVAVIVLGAR